ncbi:MULTISPECIES: C40 family peptidase [unclassified Lactococcus]|uniref:C40 family peptidase n=1 Tax=unclassified Lactococcus TaxID=2643510 RepID=UPI0011CA3AD5|nr:MULTISPECIES: C40 family peptidase [unclassified Lactococcus]MQW22326.1 peptidoglycan endopeptidase [Lactococcus sp. dk101]TXK45248.1 NlpC/P60 family protein [Lactococcus sp. dk310]TXK50973.1 NlpC/P60 family protein [Lactococcus sp. dk322]
MLKKTIIATALVASFVTFSTTKTAKADQIEVDTTQLSVLSELTEVNQSLDLLTKTMNTTVTTLANEKTAQAKAEEAKAQAVKKVSEAEQITQYAKKFLGVPYVWGGSSPSGFDCSGLTSYVYRHVLNKEIGRTSTNQIANGKHVATSQAKVGDVLVFLGGSHVGIYLGNGQFIHAPQAGEVVAISSFDELTPDYALEF